MGLYDRDYTQAEDSRQRHYGAPQFRLGLPPLTPTVKWLLIANVAIYVGGILFQSLGETLEDWFAVAPQTWVTALQPWRYITYEFLHDRGGVGHILGNMLGLFFFGPPLEQLWGRRKFLAFYLLCGACGSLFYLLLVGVRFLPAVPLIGASGSVLAVLAACAVLFPNMVVFVFILPVPIRVLAIVYVLSYLMQVIVRGANAGGDAVHLVSMAAGTAFVLLTPKWEHLHLRSRARSSKKNLQRERDLQIEVDRILAKVHQSGLHSLTSKEKKTLQKATAEENKRRSY
jgi:membrane associated rhomboid family serine protease